MSAAATPLACVCVSYNAPPLNDAESLCTIRLLSALVEEGLDVHLVTADWPATLDPAIAREIMHPAIRVTRVPRPPPSRTSRALAFARWGLHMPENGWIAPAVQATRALLRAYPRPPLLLSRAMPIVSNIVAWHARELAAAWVPHLSDPYPPFEWREHWYSAAVRPVNRRWAQRFLDDSTLLTVTCDNARRFVAEKLNRPDASARMHVLTHLARPRLESGRFQLPRDPDTFVLAHLGNLMERRRPDVLIEGVLQAASKCPGLRLFQYGNVDAAVLRRFPTERLRGVVSLHHVDNLSPRDSTDLQEQADANVIVDTDFGLPYSPFILSKYPHCVCSGKPMLMISAPDSAMHAYTRAFGGGLAVPFDAAAVAEACVQLYRADAAERARLAPPEALMAEFSPARVVQPFAARLRELAESDHG